MKKKFIKFFEIGKLERGLFRIWIIISVIWVISAYIFYSSQYEIKNQKFWDYAYSKPQIYFKPQFKHFRKAIKSKDNKFRILVWEATKRTIWAHRDIYNDFGPQTLDLQKEFNSRDECIDYYLIKKNIAFKQAIPTYLIIFLLPFLAFVFYLFSKKIFLWVGRGFK